MFREDTSTRPSPSSLKLLVEAKSLLPAQNPEWSSEVGNIKLDCLDLYIKLIGLSEGSQT